MCQVTKNSNINYDNIPCIVIKDNNIIELQSLFKRNILLANLQPELNKCYVSNKHNWITKMNVNQNKQIKISPCFHRNIQFVKANVWI
jgi:hypothetical protein